VLTVPFACFCARISGVIPDGNAGEPSQNQLHLIEEGAVARAIYNSEDKSTGCSFDLILDDIQ